MLIALVVAVALAQDADVARRLDEIVLRLSEGDIAEREAASADLRALAIARGQALRPELQRRLGSAEPDVAARLRVELDRLDGPDALRRKLAAVGMIGLPSIAERPFVLFTDWGGRDGSGKLVSVLRHGWLMSESESRITLLGPGAVLQDTRERRRSAPEGWHTLEDRPPLPGLYQVFDFAKYARSYMAENRPYYNSWALRGMATLAWWALDLGDVELASELVRPAEERLGDKLSKEIASAVAWGLRHHAVAAAYYGEPGTDLLKRWRQMAAIDPDDESTAARVKAYERMIDEDDRRREPDADELRRRPPDLQAEYWVHKLRDLQAWHYPLTHASSGQPNPAAELLKLGEAAIPTLIEHLNDERPTRAVQELRRWQSLLTVGDCCWVVFHELTGVDLPGRKDDGPGAGYRNDEPVAAMQAARAWWAREQRAAFWDPLTVALVVVFVAAFAVGACVRRRRRWTGAERADVPTWEGPWPR